MYSMCLFFPFSGVNHIVLNLFFMQTLFLHCNPIPKIIAQNNHKMSKTTNISYSDDRIFKKLLKMP